MSATLSTGSPERAPRKLSPRPRGRENAKSTPCRNIGIYGFCRYENDGCIFNHDSTPRGNTMASNENAQNKRFNAESPSFTPLQPQGNGLQPTRISPRSAQAAPFTPKSNKPSPLAQHVTPKVSPPEPQEFVPQSYDPSTTTAENSMLMDQYNQMPWSDQYAPYSAIQAGVQAAAFYNNASFQPLQYHLYVPQPLYSPDQLGPYQRSQYDFFVPEEIRREFQKRNEALLQTLPNPALLPHLDHFHSLVPVDSSNNKSRKMFGYPTWLYKATSSKDGKIYCLRRLEGFKLINENAIRALQPWKRMGVSSIVEIYDIFTTRKFGDSSLILVTEYHPASTTLSDHAFHNPSTRHSASTGGLSDRRNISEDTLTTYLVQLTMALKEIHSRGLAARIIHPSKILVTSKNRLRLNGCGILDVVTYPQDSSAYTKVEPDMADDFIQLGRLMISLTIGYEPAYNMDWVDLGNRLPSYLSARYKDIIRWLIAPATEHSEPKTAEALVSFLVEECFKVLDSAFHTQDAFEVVLSQSLEDGRIARLLMKMNLILERPDHEHNLAWSETGERYYVKLLRDYVFHAVNANGRPITDLSHILGCLNRLDAASTETIQLTSRDGETTFLVTFREMKRAIESAFNDLNGSSGGTSKGRK